MNFLANLKKGIKTFVVMGLSCALSCGICFADFNFTPGKTNWNEGIDFLRFNVSIIRQAINNFPNLYPPIPQEVPEVQRRLAIYLQVRELGLSLMVNNEANGNIYSCFDNLIGAVMLELLVSREIGRQANIQKFLMADRFITDGEIRSIAEQILAEYYTYNNNANDNYSVVSSSIK